MAGFGHRSDLFTAFFFWQNDAFCLLKLLFAFCNHRYYVAHVPGVAAAQAVGAEHRSDDAGEGTAAQ